MPNNFIPGVVLAKRWKGKKPPTRILVIRLQAMGDVVITLPYIQHLRNSLPPNTKIDFLTREETSAIPKGLLLFDKVYEISGQRNFKKQLLFTCLLLPKLLLQWYDVVIDLQNNPISRLVRKCLIPKAWSSFDRYSPISAGERTKITIEAAGLGVNAASVSLQLKSSVDVDSLLKLYGWDGKSALIILNPAGAFVTRNWPEKNYVAFARLWLQKFPNTQFVILGINMLASKAASIKNQLGNTLVNLVNHTNTLQAFAIVQKSAFVLTEDSGLMHMAWVSGRPTLAVFGSTRSDWSRPLGEHTAVLDSSDLPCGNCMLEQCKYADVHCLTRYTPGIVFAKALALLQSLAITK